MAPETGFGTSRLMRDFYERDVLSVAPDLIGTTLIKTDHNGRHRFTITETEAYRGEEDKASHARFGKTLRNGIMYGQAGLVYIYLVYGIHWMLNIVTGAPGNPQAVLIRGLSGFSGPGLVTQGLGIDKSFHGEDLVVSERLWIETDHQKHPFNSGPRVGIRYAGEPWISHPWRFVIG